MVLRFLLCVIVVETIGKFAIVCYSRGGNYEVFGLRKGLNMSYTIRQLAAEIGVSKTAVRKYMDEEFRKKYTEEFENNSILISDEGAEVLKTKCKGREKFAVVPDSFRPETANQPEYMEEVISLREQIAELKTELRIRRETESEKIETLKEQIKSLQESNQRLQ